LATPPLAASLEQRSKVGRKVMLSAREVLPILTLYHLSGFKCFDYFDERLVLGELKSYFSGACSYPKEKTGS